MAICSPSSLWIAAGHQPAFLRSLTVTDALLRGRGIPISHRSCVCVFDGVIVLLVQVGFLQISHCERHSIVFLDIPRNSFPDLKNIYAYWQMRAQPLNLQKRCLNIWRVIARFRTTMDRWTDLSYTMTVRVILAEPFSLPGKNIKSSLSDMKKWCPQTQS